MVGHLTNQSKMVIFGSGSVWSAVVVLTLPQFLPTFELASKNRQSYVSASCLWFVCGLFVCVCVCVCVYVVCVHMCACEGELIRFH